MRFCGGALRLAGVLQRFCAVALISVSGLFGALPAGAWDSGRASFQITVNDDLVIPYRIFAVYAVPGERLRFAGSGVTAAGPDGSVRPAGTNTWDWTAPRTPGVNQLEFRGHEDVIRINAVTLRPSEQAVGGALKSFRIGYYPAPLADNPAYAAPDGYIELPDESATLQLSPHFQISQFSSKQSGEFPKYLVLRESLLIKLEMLLERVNARGIEAETFAVMSGFRTPAYNHAIGNVIHSRHIYGGAADIYVDVAPRDGTMDDLNADGVLDYADAQYLYEIADKLFSEDEHPGLQGGLGVYRSTSAHGPFIHIDARGKRARWGLIP